MKLLRQLAVAGALLAAGAARAQSCVSLWYQGTGNMMTVTDPVLIANGFSAHLVILQCSGTPAVMKSYGLAGSKTAGGITLGDGINSLTVGGFVVGTDPEVNPVGQKCHAFIATDGVYAGWGTYVGDGAPSLQTTFPPSEYTLIIPSDSTPAAHLMRARGVPTEMATGNVVTGISYVGGRLTVSGNYNQPGITYGVSALTDIGAQVLTGSFVGDGVDQRSIALGGQPVMVLTESSVAGPDLWRPASLIGPSLLLDGSGAFLDGITQLQTTGFQVGTNPRVNSLGVSTFYVAFAASDVNPLDGGPRAPPDAGQGDGGPGTDGGSAGGSGGGAGGGAAGGGTGGSSGGSGGGAAGGAAGGSAGGSAGGAAGGFAGSAGGGSGGGTAGGAAAGSAGGGAAGGSAGGAGSGNRPPLAIGCACSTAAAPGWLLFAASLCALSRRRHAPRARATLFR